MAVDRRDHVWIVHRPGSFTDDEKAASFDPPRATCCVPAPSVVEFDADGNVLRSWGMPGTGFDFPKREHGIYVDPEDNVWIAGNHEQDNQVLKFTADGRFLLQIGKAGQTGGSDDTRLLGKPAQMEVDPAANELYVADGYGNRRIIVFDATTGAYKRHGAPTETGPTTPGRPTIQRLRHRNSSAAPSIAYALQGTAFCTCATGRTTASRSSASRASSCASSSWPETRG